MAISLGIYPTFSDKPIYIYYIILYYIISYHIILYTIILYYIIYIILYYKYIYIYYIIYYILKIIYDILYRIYIILYIYTVYFTFVATQTSSPWPVLSQVPAPCFGPAAAEAGDAGPVPVTKAQMLVISGLPYGYSIWVLVWNFSHMVFNPPISGIWPYGFVWT